MKWYYREYEQAIGPFEDREMKAFIQQGKVRKNTQVKKDQSNEWKRAIDSDLQTLFDVEIVSENRKRYKWYYKKGGITIGPFTEEEVVHKIKTKEIKEDMSVRLSTSDEWNNITKTFLSNYLEKKD